jgi:hypothetical protein
VSQYTEFAVSISFVISNPSAPLRIDSVRNPCFDRREKSFLRSLNFVRVCGNCHFDAKRRNLVSYVAENSRSLTAFEMTNQRKHEFSHSLSFGMTNLMLWRRDTEPKKGKL